MKIRLPLLFLLSVLSSSASLKFENAKFVSQNNDLTLSSIAFKAKLSYFDAEMKIRQKVLQSRTENEKNILRLYKAEMYNQLISKQGHPEGKKRFSFLQMKTKRPPNSKENIHKFFSDIKHFTPVTKLSDLPKKGMASVEPWSSSWWPILNGQTSVRYNKNARMNSIGIYDKNRQDFTRRFTYKESISSYSQPNEYYRYSSTDQITKEINEVWSPSEKYDLLVGDLNFTLTKSEKAHGEKYLRMYGNVPAWFGYCHGWTPASYMFKRPNRTVTLTAADGHTKIEFLPDDIRGLASAFISNSYYYTNFFGSVCNYRTTPIPKDTETGLYIDDECNDVEPGNTIAVLGNMIGKLKKNVGFDPDPDFEIWNQPIRGYKIQFFNMNTNKTAETVDEAKVKFEELNVYSGDKFLRFIKKRSPSNTDSFVGVFLTIEYVVETELKHEAHSNPDSLRTADYVGGVNLDENNNILGGEWRYNHHPDFIWRISDLVSPSSTYDKYVPNFQGTSNELKSLTFYASKQSQQRVPLKAIIEYLANSSYVEPEETPIFPSIILETDYVSIGNGNPLINWGNGIYSVRSEDNTIIFTGTAVITRTEPSGSYYRFIDPDNGVAYYSLNPFVFRTKPYEEKDDFTKPENWNNGNDPQIGSKKLVYCEGNYRYTLTGEGIISTQCPAKGNYFNFVTKGGTTFFCLKSFSISYGEVEDCDPEDYATGAPTVDSGDGRGNVPTTPSNNGENADRNVKEIKIKTHGREYTLKGYDEITKERPYGSYFMFTLPNGETYYSKSAFSVTYIPISEERNNNSSNRGNDRNTNANTNNESETNNGNVIKIRTHGKEYILKGLTKISKERPFGSYYKYTLPNGDTYYSKTPFTVTYITNNNHSNDENSGNNFSDDDEREPPRNSYDNRPRNRHRRHRTEEYYDNYNNYLEDYYPYNTGNSYNTYLSNYLSAYNSLYGMTSPNTVSRVINGRIYTISGQSQITLTRPSGRHYYYDTPDGIRYYSATPFSVSIS